jgi:hypothetical protein
MRRDQQFFLDEILGACIRVSTHTANALVCWLANERWPVSYRMASRFDL